MSFRLKAASLVAVVISAVATFVATDPSFASGTADSAATIAISSRALTATDAASASSAATDQTPVSIVHNADGTVTVTPRTPSTSASLDELVQAQVVPAELDPELKCLAGAVYFESKGRSEEHTSELQSLLRIPYAVFCLK